MRKIAVFSRIVLSAAWVSSGACKPPTPDGETGTSGTGDAGTSATTGATTEGAGPCGVDGVQFNQICFRRYEFDTISANFIHAADFNGDGRPDLALDNGTTRELKILYWNGPEDLQLSAAVTRTGGGGSDIQVFAADLDGDADIDVGILQDTMEIVTLADGQPISAKKLSFGQNVGYGAVFDVDGDSMVEVFIDTFDGVQLWRRMGDAYVLEGATYPVPGCGYLGAMTAADFNGDGITDVALVATDTCGNVDLELLPPSMGVVLLGNADRTFTKSDEIWAGTEPQAAHTADFNGDGRLDLAIRNWTSKDVSILLGKGDGTFDPDVRHRPGFPPAHLGMGDLDGDGKDEVVTEGAYKVVAVSAPHLGSEAVQLLADVAGPVAVADLNQDGYADIAARAGDGSNRLVLLVSGGP